MSRFATLTKADIDELVAKKNSERTHKASDCALNILTRYCLEKNIILDLKTVDCNTLDAILSQFYAEARKDGGGLYKKSMQALRYGLHRTIKAIRNDVNIMDENKHFRRSNEVFTAQLVHLKTVGLAKVEHKPPISKHDLEVLYSFGVYSLESLLRNNVVPMPTWSRISPFFNNRLF